MKIILVTSMSGLGGTETATFRLARLLHQHQHQVILASSDGPLVQEATQLGIEWYPVDFYQGGIIGYLKGMARFYRLLKREQPDIVHCQMARVVPGCAMAAKLASPRTKVFYHARGLRAETYPKITRLFNQLGVYIIANCQTEQAKLIRHGFPPERITYTYNALAKVTDPAKPAAKPDIVFGTLSRLDKVRAVDIALDLFKELADKGLPVKLWVAGIGEESEALKQQAQRLGIGHLVTFLGGVRDLQHYFSEVDILLNTLRCTGDHGAGVGNNILEAGQYQTPVISYDTAGIAEMVIDGQTGYCIPQFDNRRFVAEMEKLALDPDLRLRLGQALKQHVETLCSDDEIYRTTMMAYHL